jgi:GTP-binding protein LepA
MNNIRNFVIIAHIDHGKSTLADRMLEMTKTIEGRDMKEQLLDTMDLERERGITIKLQPVTMKYHYKGHKIQDTRHKQIPNSKSQIQNNFKIENSDIENSLKTENCKLKIEDSEFTLNLIDTPGHVDFGYEVSRSLKAVEGAVLLVDSTQGVQAQTLANLYQAIEQDLEIIPVVNKIDLPNAEVKKTKAEIISLLGCGEDEILEASGKTGEGVDEILRTVVEKIPAPEIKEDEPLRALIFDSKYDSYKGVLAFVRIFQGKTKREDDIYLMAGNKKAHSIEVGKFSPDLKPTEFLRAGDIGYIATGLKSVDECRVGDTITLVENSKENAVQPLSGYKEVEPMMYASFYPSEGEDYNQMRDALEKLKLNDASLVFEGESSPALGRGFRIGFLGVLHLEIIKERLFREYDFEPVITTPSVVYEIKKTTGEVFKIYSAAEMPEPTQIEEIREPRVKLDIIMPSKYLGEVMDLVQSTTRSEYLSTEYLDAERLTLSFNAPLADIIVNFHDNLKSATSGFASFAYELVDYQPADLVRLDIYVAEDKVDSFSQIVHRQNSLKIGNKVVKKLKDVIPRQNFLIKIQAAVGGKILARENIRPFRKDVTAGMYGGDITRKRKLLEKQKKGKSRMKQTGRVEIPQKAFLEVLKK